MEAECSSEMSVSAHKITRRHNPEVHNFETSTIFAVRALSGLVTLNLCVRESEHVLDMRTAEAGFEVNDIPV
jgi:hypothetical protein